MKLSSYFSVMFAVWLCAAVRHVIAG